jgi:protein involved in polysaccharide export with SLBB domain
MNPRAGRTRDECPPNRKEVRSMKFRNPGVALLVTLLVMGAAAARAVPAPQAVDPGDVLQIEVYAGGEKQHDFSVTVSPEHTIMCPLIGSLEIDSTGTTGIGEKLRTIFARDYYVDPQVLVSVKEHGAKIYVLGEVKHPGIYPLRDGPTLLSACALAGGFTDFAAPQHVKITRSEDGKLRFINVDFTKAKHGKTDDVRLRDGDRLEVPHRLF